MRAMIPHSDTRIFTVDSEGFGVLRFRVLAELDGRSVCVGGWKLWRSAGRQRVFRAEDRRGAWRLELRAAPDHLVVSLSARLKCRVDRAVLTPVCLMEIPARHILAHGRKMGGCSSRILQAGVEHSFESEFFVAVTFQGHTLQLSHPLRQRDISSMSGRARGRVVERLSAFTTCEPRGRRCLRADPVTLSVARDGHLQLREWAEAQVTGEPLLEDSRRCGWNTWDYYRWTVTEEDVLKNAEFIASDPVLSKRVRHIVIDDGWQYCYGEWEPNPRFPSGMGALAGELARMGFIPGLWVAPLIVEPHARVAQLQPEMLAPGRAGVPSLLFSCMGRNGFVLDPTHPKTAAWWRDIFRRCARQGFRFFKLDFLGEIFKAGRLHDPRVHPGDLMRRILEPIREGAGSTARLLGCNFTFEGGRGLAEEVRIASDIHASWNFVKRNAVAIAARFWAHRRLWMNDPDFAICRGGETSNDPHLERLKMLLPCVSPQATTRRIGAGLDALDGLADFTLREAETWLSLVVISGGTVNFSDNLTRLNQTGLRLIRKVAAASRGEAGIAQDLFRSDLPALWTQRVEGSPRRALIINWADGERSLRISERDIQFPLRNARNFWTGATGFSKGERITLPPHGCLFLERE